MSHRRLQAIAVLVLAAIGGIFWTARIVSAQAADSAEQALRASFDQQVKPFLTQNCIGCHNADLPTSGVSLEQLDASLTDRQVRLWEVVQKRIVDQSMPPASMPQPSDADRSAATIPLQSRGRGRSSATAPPHAPSRTIARR